MADERDARRRRWEIWHTAYLPMMKTPVGLARFVDPQGKTTKASAAQTFLALRRSNGDAVPAWVLEKFGLAKPL